MIALNQTPRSIAHSSPFVRITTVEEAMEDAAILSPGWFIATLDAPVIGLQPYIWRHGHRFIRLAEWLLAPGEHGNRKNVLPHTIARYARLLRERGVVAPGALT